MTAKLLTVAQAADRLKMDARIVRRYCALGHAGTKVGRDWALTEADVGRLRQFAGRKPGNPGKGDAPKKARKKR